MPLTTDWQPWPGNKRQKQKEEPLVILHCEQEAARLLGLSARTLQRFRKDGCGPQFIRRGRRFVGYSDQALTDWISQRTYPSIAAECAAAKRDSHGDAGLNHGG